MHAPYCMAGVLVCVLGLGRVQSAECTQAVEPHQVGLPVVRLGARSGVEGRKCGSCRP